MYRYAARYLCKHLKDHIDEISSIEKIKDECKSKLESLTNKDLLIFKEGLVNIINSKDEDSFREIIRESICSILFEYNTNDTELYLSDIPEPPTYKDLVRVLNSLFINLVVDYTEEQHNELINTTFKDDDIKISYLQFIRLNIIKSVYSTLMAYSDNLIKEDRFTITHLKVPVFKSKDEISEYLMLSILYYGNIQWKK